MTRVSLTERADELRRQIRDLQREVKSAYPASRAAQMAALLHVDASLVAAEIYHAEQGTVRPELKRSALRIAVFGVLPSMPKLAKGSPPRPTIAEPSGAAE